VFDRGDWRRMRETGNIGEKGEKGQRRRLRWEGCCVGIRKRKGKRKRKWEGEGEGEVGRWVGIFWIEGLD